MRETLTTAKGHKLKDGTILGCIGTSGFYYVGLLDWNEHIGPMFRTFSVKDKLEDSWEIADWSRYSLATESEYVMWKLENL